MLRTCWGNNKAIIYQWSEIPQKFPRWLYIRILRISVYHPLDGFSNTEAAFETLKGMSFGSQKLCDLVYEIRSLPVCDTALGFKIWSNNRYTVAGIANLHSLSRLASRGWGEVSSLKIEYKVQFLNFSTSSITNWLLIDWLTSSCYKKGSMNLLKKNPGINSNWRTIRRCL